MYRFPRSLPMLCLILVACHTWEASPEAIPQHSLKKGSTVRVNMANGARLEVTGAYLKSDSLIGRAAHERIAIPFTDIKRIDTARFSSDRTAVVVVAGVLAIPVGFILLLLLSGESIAPTF